MSVKHFHFSYIFLITSLLSFKYLSMHDFCSFIGCICLLLIHKILSYQIIGFFLLLVKLMGHCIILLPCLINFMLYLIGLDTSRHQGKDTTHFKEGHITSF